MKHCRVNLGNLTPHLREKITWYQIVDQLTVILQISFVIILSIKIKILPGQNGREECDGRDFGGTLVVLLLLLGRTSLMQSK